MSPRSLIIAACSTLVVVASCSTDQEFALTLQESFVVTDTLNVSDTLWREVDPSTTWSKFGSIAGSITSLTVPDGATYVIVRDSGDTGQFARVSLGIGSADGKPPITIVWSDTSLPLLNAVGVVQTMVFTDSSKSELARIFRTAPYRARWYFYAIANKTPTYFEVVFRIPLRGSYASSWL